MDDEDKKRKSEELEDEEKLDEKEEKDLEDLDSDLDNEEADMDKISEDERKIEDPFEDDEDNKEKSSFAKASEDKEDEEEIETMDESEADKIEEERDEKKGVDEFEDKTEDEAEPLLQEDEAEPLLQDKTEGFYKPQDRTENYYQEMKADQEESHIPSLGSMNSHMSSSSNIYANQQRVQKGSKWHVLILIIIGLIVISGTVYFLKNNFNIGIPALPFLSSQSTPEPTPAAEVATPEPTPTPPPLERSEFKLEILNGTSTSGMAASTSSKLQDLGYEVVRVGNATNSAFETTLVRVKPDALNLAEQIIKDLSPEFTGILDATLPESETNDSVIILGTK